MSNYNVPSELRYSENHEWVRSLGGNKYRVGLSDYAAQHIGDVTFVELPEVGSEVDKESVECVVETVKSSEDIYNQISGTVSAVNDSLEDNSEVVNSDCYGDGWLYEITADGDEDFNSLMTAEEYEKYLAEMED